MAKIDAACILKTPADLRAMRQRLGLSQADAGALVGVPHTTLSRWERGVQAWPLSAERLLLACAIHSDLVATLTDATPGDPMETHSGLPIAGYQPQPQSAVDQVNEHKKAEERLLRVLDLLALQQSTDMRWLALARTHLEIGFMALNRAVFRPARIALPEDKPADAPQAGRPAAGQAAFSPERMTT